MANRSIIEVCGSHECIIAEDLGIIPPEVTELRQRHKLEGWACYNSPLMMITKTIHKPENITIDRVVYTGTHDNNATKGWWDEKKRKRLKPYIKEGESVCQTVKHNWKPRWHGNNSNSRHHGIRFTARMNTPGVAHGNWKWKFSWDDLWVMKLKLN